MSGFQFLSGLLFLVEFLEFLLCSEISCFGFPKLFGIFRVALLFICQGALLTAYPSRLSTFFRSFSVGSLFSLTTFIGYHIFIILSTTFFNFFRSFFEGLLSLFNCIFKSLNWACCLTCVPDNEIYYITRLFFCQQVFSIFLCFFQQYILYIIE